jgi:acetyl-CoA carboxylase carboxyltransferase component
MPRPIMTERTASIGVGGTHLVRASLSLDFTPLELGDAQIHDPISGVADQTTQSDEEAIAQIKEFLQS